jgi:peroxin-2
MRVNQLDAAHLDEEVTSILGSQARGAFKFLAPSLVSWLKPELDALLQLALFRFTVFVDRPTPGHQLQNLRYRNEAHAALAEAAAPRDPAVFVLTRTQKTLYALLSIGGRWAWQRLRGALTARGWRLWPEGSLQRRVAAWVERAEWAYRLASVSNFVLFLWEGRYRSVLERLLRMRLVYAHARASRQLNFEYMNQQLVWQGLAEFLLFIVPLIDFARIKALLLRALGVASAPDARGGGCPVCGSTDMVTPYEARCVSARRASSCARRLTDSPHAAALRSCGCVYCYYCLRASRVAESAFRCPRCSTLVTGQRRAQLQPPPQ